MYGIFPYIYHKNQPNVGKYTIHGWYGLEAQSADLVAQRLDVHLELYGRCASHRQVKSCLQLDGGSDIRVCTHRIHVWDIYLHLVDFYGKCR